MTTNNEVQDLRSQVRALRAEVADLRRERATTPNKRDLADCRNLRKVRDGQTDVYDSSVGGWVPVDLPTGGGGGAGAATITIAPSNASAASLATASYVLTGTADQTIINAALATMTVGGVAVILEGTVNITATITVPTLVSLRGMGWLTTIIACGGSFSGVALTMSAGQNHLSDVQITASTSAYGISAGPYTVIEDCLLFNGFTRGISLGSNVAAVIVRNCEIEELGSSASYGVYMTGGNDHCRIINTRFDGVGIGIRVSGTWVTVANNEFFNAYRQAIVIDGATKSTVHGNIVAEPSQQTHNTYDGIQVVSGTANSVQGNVVTKGTGNQPRYGIRLESGATNTLVTNNMLLNSAATSSLSDAGTGTTTAAGNRL